MERLSKTFSGAKSTLSDNIDLLAASIGKILLPLAVSLVEEFTNAVKVTNAFVKSFEDASKTDLDKRIESTKDNLADLVDELREAKEDGKGFFESQEEYEAGLRRTEQAIRDTTATLKKLNAAKRVEAETGIGKKTEAEEETETQFDQSIIDKAQEIDQKLIALSEQYYANRNARAKTQNEEEIAILDERFAQVQEKLVEQQATRLELLGEFDEAEKLQVQAKLQAIEDAENAQIERRKTAAAKARKDEINFDKITTKAKLKFEEQTWAERAKTSQAGLSALASIQRTGSKEAFEIGKAASIAQALVSIPSTAIKAYESLAGIPYVGPALGAAAAAAAIAAGTARINQIRSTKFQAFADGGLVEGGIKGVDSVPAMLTPGEVVVPEKSFADLRFNNEQQVFETRAVRSTLDETNGLLRQIASQRALSTGPSEDFLERKFSSTTPGGIFYEPVDDSLPEEEVAAQVRVSSGGVPGSLIARGELKNREQIRRGA
jgi:chemotaxis protein histidine kinase CheA